MTASGAPQLWRVGWLDGQRLEARDLTAQVGREAYTRRVHTSVVHDTWGIAVGFGIATGIGGAPLTVTVAPGLAYDRLGRELVSGRTLVVPPPRPPADGVAHWVDLVARWATAEDLAAGSDPVVCLDGPSTSGERPLLRWVDAGPVRHDDQGDPLRPSRYGRGVRLGLDVPLARLVVQPDGSLGGLDLSGRRKSHGRVRPHIATGTVRQAVSGITGDQRAWSVSVDTAAGGFTTSSVAYVASLGAHPWGASSGFNSGTVGAGAQQSARELLATQLAVGQGPFLEISEPDRVHFKLTVRHGLPERLGFRPIDLDVNPVPVSWVGIEWLDPTRGEPT